jgi:hypothetical protein
VARARSRLARLAQASRIWSCIKIKGRIIAIEIAKKIRSLGGAAEIPSRKSALASTGCDGRLLRTICRTTSGLGAEAGRRSVLRE